jgi:hypothetical protein
MLAKIFDAFIVAVLRSPTGRQITVFVDVLQTTRQPTWRLMSGRDARCGRGVAAPTTLIG